MSWKITTYFDSSQGKFLFFFPSFLLLSKHLYLTQTFDLRTTSKCSRAFSLSVTKRLSLRAEGSSGDGAPNPSHLPLARLYLLLLPGAVTSCGTAGSKKRKDG